MGTALCTRSAEVDSAEASVGPDDVLDAAHSDLTPLGWIKSVVAKKKP